MTFHVSARVRGALLLSLELLFGVCFHGYACRHQRFDGGIVIARFAQHFPADGSVTPEITATQQDRLENWRTLQEMAGIR